MTFSPEWDQTYRRAKHLSRWPWSDLVSYVYRYVRPVEGFHRVLELGCGAGANIPLFLKLGFDYFGIEGSPEIVAQLHNEYPELKDKIVAGDFTSALPFEGEFDVVVDRSSLTHNTTAAIERSLLMAINRLRPGGKLVGIDWFSTVNPDSGRGQSLDSHTRSNIPSGQFAGLGSVHFSDKGHLIDLLTSAGFQIERLEHKQMDTYIPEAANRMGWWNFVAVKK